MLEKDPRITVRREHHVLLVTIDRPDARNAIAPEMAWTLSAIMDEYEADTDLRACVLTGSGGIFSAGADLKVAAKGRAPLPPRGNFGVCVTPPAKPLIAAVEGLAVGGGLEMILACDIVVAARDARLGLPEVRRGVVPAAGGALRLPRRIPRALAMDMALTGEFRTAEQLAGHGLISRLVEPGEALSTAMEIASVIARNAPLAVSTTCRVMRQASDWSDAEGFERQIPLIAAVRASDDMAEGIRAFVEKREPQWSGR